MKYDAMREPGFYWVRFEGEVVIGEYTQQDGYGYWQFPGCDEPFNDKEVCDLLSNRLMLSEALA